MRFKFKPQFKPQFKPNFSLKTPTGFDLDRGVLFVSLFLLGLGLVQVYSSSFIFAIERYEDGLYFFRRQFLFSVLAIVALFGVSYMPSKWLRIFGIGLFFAAVVGLVLTMIPGIGVRVGGAHRWIQTPFGVRFEPSEFFKIILPLWMAYLGTIHWRDLTWTKRILGVLSIVTPLLLLLRQPDFGSFAICVAILIGLLFSLGMAWRWVALGVTAASFGFYFLIVQVPYRMARLAAFIDPWSDPEVKGFQVIQSLLSFYSGGVTGSGLGQGQGKLFFLPEAHTDFTAAVLAEEMGFIGIALLLGLFGYLVLRGFQIAARTQDRFWQIVALGVTMAFGLNSLLNFAVAMGLLPTKGLALPFISYGGSSLVANAMAIGLLLNIDRQTQLEKLRSFKGITIR